MIITLTPRWMGGCVAFLSSVNVKLLRGFKQGNSTIQSPLKKKRERKKGREKKERKRKKRERKKKEGRKKKKKPLWQRKGLLSSSISIHGTNNGDWSLL